MTVKTVLVCKLQILAVLTHNSTHEMITSSLLCLCLRGSSVTFWFKDSNSMGEGVEINRDSEQEDKKTQQTSCRQYTVPPS